MTGWRNPKDPLNVPKAARLRDRAKAIKGRADELLREADAILAEAEALEAVPRERRPQKKYPAGTSAK